MFPDDYRAAFSKVTASEDTYRRILAMTQRQKTRKSVSYFSKALIAAIVISLLAVTASAAESGWFTRFFSPKGGIPLTDSQIQLLDEIEQPIQDAKTQEEWTVELRSAMNDGNIGYIILGVTAPEGISLEQVYKDNMVVSQIELQNHSLRANEAGLPCSGPEIIRWPEGVRPCAYSMQWSDDGDGKENTQNYVIEIYTDSNRNEVQPFGPDAQWGIFVEGFVRESDNEAYRQELMNGKYKGQTDVMFTHEEVLQLTLQEVLTDNSWEFTFRFNQSDEGIELLSQPIETMAEFGIDQAVRKKVRITSLRLTPLTLKVYHEGTDVPHFSLDDQAMAAVMKDGSKIYLIESYCADGYVLLEAGYPMVPEEVDYILFRDGTKVPMPG